MKDERIILSISMEEIDNAIEIQELDGFFKSHPEVKAEALNWASQRLSRYIDHNDFVTEIILDAVYDAASAFGYKD